MFGHEIPLKIPEYRTDTYDGSSMEGTMIKGIFAAFALLVVMNGPATDTKPWDVDCGKGPAVCQVR